MERIKKFTSSRQARTDVFCHSEPSEESYHTEFSSASQKKRIYFDVTLNQVQSDKGFVTSSSSMQ